MSLTLYLSPPSFDGFDGGAGARYQARRESTSYLVSHMARATRRAHAQFQAHGLCPHNIDLAKCLAEAKNFDHVIITPPRHREDDCKVAEALKAQKPDTKIGFIGAHTMVVAHGNPEGFHAIDWVGRKEFDYTCKEVAEDRDLSTINGLSYKKQGRQDHP